VLVFFVIKAIHIELVSDLSTDSFLGALKRFTARGGRPLDVFCHNATNFTEAKKKLEALKEFLFKKETIEKTNQFCHNEFINFRFIPPRAPYLEASGNRPLRASRDSLIEHYGMPDIHLKNLALRSDLLRIQTTCRIEMCHLSVISIYGYMGGRQI